VVREPIFKLLELIFDENQWREGSVSSNRRVCSFELRPCWPGVYLNPALVEARRLIEKLRKSSWEKLRCIRDTGSKGDFCLRRLEKVFKFFFVLGIFDEHAVFGAVDFDILKIKWKAFIIRSSTCQVEYFTIKRNTIWRQISLFDIACGNFAADEDVSCGRVDRKMVDCQQLFPWRGRFRWTYLSSKDVLHLIFNAYRKDYVCCGELKTHILLLKVLVWSKIWTFCSLHISKI